MYCQYINDYVLVTAVIIQWGCMVTDDGLIVLSPNEANSSIICYQAMCIYYADNLSLLYMQSIIMQL